MMITEQRVNALIAEMKEDPEIADMIMDQKYQFAITIQSRMNSWIEETTPL